jgi:transposase
MGVTNYVVQPQDWDERGKGVKTDRIDALALCQRLDRYTRGNLKAFSIVRVPTEDEERQRAFTRQRQSFRCHCLAPRTSRKAHGFGSADDADLRR